MSSDGKIHIYDLYDLPEFETEPTPQKIKEIQPVAMYDTKGTRLTCVTLAEGDMPTASSHTAEEEEDRDDHDDTGPNLGEKRKHDGDVENEEEEGEDGEWGGVDEEVEEEEEEEGESE